MDHAVYGPAVNIIKKKSIPALNGTGKKTELRSKLIDDFCFVAIDKKGCNDSQNFPSSH